MRTPFSLFVDGVDDLLQFVHGDIPDDGTLHRAIDPECDGPSGIGRQQMGYAPRLVGDGVAFVLLKVAIASMTSVITGEDCLRELKFRRIPYVQPKFCSLILPSECPYCGKKFFAYREEEKE